MMLLLLNTPSAVGAHQLAGPSLFDSVGKSAVTLIDYGTVAAHSCRVVVLPLRRFDWPRQSSDSSNQSSTDHHDWLVYVT
jgi:hypothetical protein